MLLMNNQLEGTNNLQILLTNSPLVEIHNQLMPLMSNQLEEIRATKMLLMNNHSVVKRVDSKINLYLVQKEDLMQLPKERKISLLKEVLTI